MSRKIHFIVNPAAGKPYPILHTINSVCNRLKCDWDISVTRMNKVYELAHKAAQSDADIIAVYGGDGTIAQVAAALVSTDKTLGILPGGTANILSAELGLPQDIKKACILLCSDSAQTKKIDIGQIGDKLFLLRLGFGLEAIAVEGAQQSFKNQVGWLAYALSSLQALIKTRSVNYEMVIDGKKHDCKGVSLIIANSGNLGIPNISLLPDIKMTDGLLDVILIDPAGLKKLFSLKEEDNSRNILLGLFKHWKAKSISVKIKPEQPIHYDGEVIKKSFVEVKVIPESLKVVCRE